MLKKCIAVLLFTILCSVSAFAEERKISITPKIGTLGLGIDAAYKFNPNLKARLGINYFGLSLETEVEKVKYEINFKAQSFGLLADYHPFQGGFRLSAGLYKTNAKLNIDAASSESYEIQGNTYNASDLGKLSGAIKWDKVGPYLGIGYETGFSSNSRFALAFDLGALHIGKAGIDYNATGAATDPRLRDDIEKERKEVEKQLGDQEWYPVFSLGLAFRF